MTTITQKLESGQKAKANAQTDYGMAVAEGYIMLATELLKNGADPLEQLEDSNNLLVKMVHILRDDKNYPQLVEEIKVRIENNLKALK